MSSIEQIARQYRGIRCNHIAQGLADLLRQAEANEISYLAFAEALVTHEQQRRKADFPVDKRLTIVTTTRRGRRWRPCWSRRATIQGWRSWAKWSRWRGRCALPHHARHSRQCRRHLPAAAPTEKRRDHPRDPRLPARGQGRRTAFLRGQTP